MKTQHTPGPWIASLVPSSLKNNNHFEVGADSPHMEGLRQTVCSINGPHNHENYAANAGLIAAAPELLAAAEHCIREMDAATAKLRAAGLIPAEQRPDPAHDPLRAAIAKAKGQP